MVANMAVKRLQYMCVYLSSNVRYKDKWGVDLDNSKVIESILCSDSTLEMLQYKMAANIEYQNTKICIYISAQKWTIGLHIEILHFQAIATTNDWYPDLKIN